MLLVRKYGGKQNGEISATSIVILIYRPTCTNNDLEGLLANG
jgi:hypothetical protein